MKFTTSCFVRVEDVEKRKKLVEWLEGQIGYRYCVGCFNARSAIDSPLIPYVLVSTRAETGWVECFAQRPDEGIDCSTNIDLFKALAAMNDENDRDQWFMCHRGSREDFYSGHLFHYDEVYCLCSEIEQRTYFRKATAEEIIEHFKN